MVSLQRLEVGKVAENTPKRVGKAPSSSLK